MYYKGVYCMVRTHPSRDGFDLSISQEVNDLVALHIHENGTERPSSSEREIIYSELNHLFNRC